MLPFPYYVYYLYNVCADILPNPHPLHMQSNLYTNTRFIIYIRFNFEYFAKVCRFMLCQYNRKRERRSKKKRMLLEHKFEKQNAPQCETYVQNFFPFIIIIIVIILIIHFVAVLIVFTILRMWIQNLILLLDFAWTLNLFTAIFHFKMYYFRYYNI